MHPLSINHVSLVMSLSKQSPQKDAPLSHHRSIEQFAPLVAFFCIPSLHDPFDCKIFTPHRVSSNISNVDEKFFYSIDILSTSPSRHCHPHHFSSHFFSLSSLLCNSIVTLLVKLLQYSAALVSTFFSALGFAESSSTRLMRFS